MSAHISQRRLNRMFTMIPAGSEVQEMQLVGDAGMVPVFGQSAKFDPDAPAVSTPPFGGFPITRNATMCVKLGEE